jgi:hypothetical protein
MAMQLLFAFSSFSQQARFEFYTTARQPSLYRIRPGENHLHRFVIEENGSIGACGQDRNLIYYDAVRDTLLNYHEALKEWLPSAR